MSRNRVLFLCLFVLTVTAVTVAAQDVPSPAVHVLLVDATKTFSSTVRVGALAGAIRSTGIFDLAVCFSIQPDPYQDPLAGAESCPAELYDVVIAVPRGVDDGTAHAIWIVTNVLPATAPAEWPAIALLSNLIDSVFTGLATAVDPVEDLWPAFQATLYQTQGWLR